MANLVLRALAAVGVAVVTAVAGKGTEHLLSSDPAPAGESSTQTVIAPGAESVTNAGQDATNVKGFVVGKRECAH